MRPIIIHESDSGDEIDGGRKGMVALTDRGRTSFRLILSTGAEEPPDIFIELQPGGWAIYCHTASSEGVKVTIDPDSNFYQTEEL